MARVTMLGVGPMMFEGPNVYSGSANRVWQLTAPLLERGHELTLICMRPTGGEGASAEPQEIQVRENLRYIALDEVTQFRVDEILQEYVDRSRPEVLVGVNVYPGARAASLRRTVPLWVDMNGYTMGEAQAKAKREEEDGYVVHFYDIVRQALSSGEAYSACSSRYREGLIGELLVMGRDVEEDDVYTIHEAKEPPEPDADAVRALRNELADEEEFLVLWSGGFNTWVDAKTLYEALEYAMDRNPLVRFVSTGGAIAGHDEKTYPEFVERVENSKYRFRFHLLGWVPMERAQTIFYAADAGITADRDCAETRLGARNRITEMLATGLVPIGTRGTEIVEICEREGLGPVTPSGNPEAMGEAILTLAQDPELCRTLSAKGRAYAREHFSYDACAREFVEWIGRAASPSK